LINSSVAGARRTRRLAQGLKIIRKMPATRPGQPLELSASRNSFGSILTRDFFADLIVPVDGITKDHFNLASFSIVVSRRGVRSFAEDRLADRVGKDLGKI
jgi:hypothetical protein